MSDPTSANSEELERLRERVASLEADLARSRERQSLTEQLVERAPIGIQVFDKSGLTVLLNKAQTDFLGLPDPEMASGFNVLTDPFSVENGSAKLFERALSGEVVQPPEMEVDLSRAMSTWGTADRRAVLQQIIAPVVDSDGEVIAAASFLFDVTERRRTEQALVESQRHESLGLLAGSIAHDFNNLLVGVLGNASLALTELPGESPAHTVILRIERAARRAAELTHQMLAYAGRGRFVIEPIDLNEVTSELVELLKTTLSPNATLRTELTAELPTIMADPSQVSQVVLNLITNANNSLPEAGGSIVVASGFVEADLDYLNDAQGISVPRPGPYVTLEVCDSGSGMDAETQARMFEPFFTTRPEGHGLGLAATLGIVRAHNGAIRVYSEPGRGTTVKVLFPAVPGAAREPTPPRGEMSVPDAGSVLVIDDTAEVRELARAILEGEGFEVSDAADGPAGVALFEAAPDQINLVLLDLTMPGWDGFETFNRLRAIRPDVRVVLSSGYSNQETTTRFAGKGLAGFLQKPYTVAQLLDCVAEALSDEAPAGS